MMTDLWTQVRWHLKRLIQRDIKSFIASLIFPIFFYILYTKFLTFDMDAQQMRRWQLEYLVSMSVYGMVLTSIQTVSLSLIKDQQQQFDRFVRLSPQSFWTYTLSICLTYIPLHITLLILLTIIAWALHGISVSIFTWVIYLVCMVIGSGLFSLMGVLISFARTNAMANILSNLTVFPMAILGGLWWPIYIMPEWIQAIGKRLPTYLFAEIVRPIVLNTSISLENVFGCLLWFTGLFLAIIGITQRQKTK